MSNLTLVEIAENKNKCVMDVIAYIKSYDLDLGIQNEANFKESFHRAIESFASEQSTRLQLAKVKTAHRKLTFEQDI